MILHYVFRTKYVNIHVFILFKYCIQLIYSINVTNVILNLRIAFILVV